MRRVLPSLLVLSLGIAPAARAVDPPITANEMIAARRGGMAEQAGVVAAILRAIAGGDDLVPFASAGSVMAAWSRGMPALFPPGTEAGNTQARPAVWSDRAGFERSASRLAQAAEAMASAASAGDRPAFLSAFRATSLACAECHVAYRSGRN
jgi:cytochrome c556